ncbi:Isy1-domain-containing protein [Ceraceosorus guamensis]|uniref:Isy1-domain-containing protein n=1 Tax=Ceraceosorus guamensis TaxID=1522189 RepID=A0A316W3Q7_9BASI|nr:Isy1-domain-containing protein [Ceraceosorus guamensis]PWN44332.1 Isy1-domain-containing protein [Ceraceosorus guamensis]
MARNKEKAQSMLHRFREAQAIELGLGSGATGRGPGAGDRRPRLASSVKTLKECEKWRSEVLREISRKVSKIQDFGLTDYEVRDLNDEINKLIREKGHWESQIVNLGGANYKRGVPKMLDDSGKEVPGTRGYKYFGRAKDLPGVKELLSRTQAAEDEAESYRVSRYRRFLNQPGSYYGDDDEEDTPSAGGSNLLEEERRAEEAKWREGWADLLETLDEELPDDGVSAIPSLPSQRPKRWKDIISAGGLQASPATLAEESTSTEGAASARGKRSTAGRPSDSDEKGGKRARGEDGEPLDGSEAIAEETQDVEMAGAGAEISARPPEQAITANDAFFDLLSALDKNELKTPSVPDRGVIEQLLLRQRKRALREQYIG